MKLGREAGLVTRMFHIPNTDERFTTDPTVVFVTLTPESAPVPFSIHGSRLDRNYLQLAIAALTKVGGPPNIVFNCVVEITAAEHISLSDLDLGALG